MVISDWKHDYNHHRRPSALGYPPTGSGLGPLRSSYSAGHRSLSSPIGMPGMSTGRVLGIGVVWRGIR